MSNLAVTTASRELETKCLQLLREGKTQSAIAAELSITAKKVGQIVRRAYARAEYANELEIDIQRKTVLGRLDAMISAVYRQAIGEEPRVVKLQTGEEVVVKSPNLEAIKVIRDLDKSRRELLGLDLASKKEQSGNVQVVVSYVQQSGTTSDTPTQEPAITVDYTDVTPKCLPEPESQK